MTKFRLMNTINRISLLYIPIILVLVFVLTPFFWAVSNSLKNNSEIVSNLANYLPNTVTLQNYRYIWTLSNFSLYFKNSIIISLCSVILVFIFALANGYAISRFKFIGKSIFIIILVCSQFIPIVMLLVPQFIIFKEISLINNAASVIITNTVTSIPFNSVLMASFINNVPKQIDEAAMVDGATRSRILITIIPFTILPGIINTIAFAFIGSWNDFLVAFTFLMGSKKFTISIGLRYLIGEFSVDYAGLSAGSIIALIPPMIIFAFAQKYMKSGLNAGAIKG
jgi:multiple sugar transport system permease protein